MPTLLDDVYTLLSEDPEVFEAVIGDGMTKHLTEDVFILATRASERKVKLAVFNRVQAIASPHTSPDELQSPAPENHFWLLVHEEGKPLTCMQIARVLNSTMN